MDNKLTYFEMNKNKLKIYDKEAHEKLEALITEFNSLLSKVITTDNIDRQSVLYADKSGNSDYATTAGSANSANHATTADSATTAATAGTANSVEWDNVQNKPNIPILKTEFKTLNFTLNAGARQEFNVPINLSGTLLGITVVIDNKPAWFKTQLGIVSMDALTISISNEYTDTLTSNCKILILYI